MVRNQAETAEDAESTGEHHRIPQHANLPSFPDFVLFDGSFSCGIVYSRVKRTPETEKKKTYVYLIKRKNQKENVGMRIGYVHIPFCSIIALERGVNSNPSSRERLFLRTAYIPFCSSTRRRCEL